MPQQGLQAWLVNALSSDGLPGMLVMRPNTFDCSLTAPHLTGTIPDMCASAASANSVKSIESHCNPNLLDPQVSKQLLRVVLDFRRSCHCRSSTPCLCCMAHIRDVVMLAATERYTTGTFIRKFRPAGEHQAGALRAAIPWFGGESCSGSMSAFWRRKASAIHSSCEMDRLQ